MKPVSALVQPAKILKRYVWKNISVLAFVATVLLVAVSLVGFSLYSDRHYEMWAEWQDRGHTGSSFYPAKAMPFGHNLHDPMWPWDGELSRPGNFGPGKIVPLLSRSKLDRSVVTPADVLDFRKLGYVYAPPVSHVEAS